VAPAPVRVGVFPAAELEHRRNLFAALELAFPVRFEGRASAEPNDLGGALDLGDGAQAAAAAAAGVPSLLLLRSEPAEDRDSVDLALSEAPELDSHLRGAHLPDRRLDGALRAGGGLETKPSGSATASRVRRCCHRASWSPARPCANASATVAAPPCFHSSTSSAS
jgi:hypothetical protein